MAYAPQMAKSSDMGCSVQAVTSVIVMDGTTNPNRQQCMFSERPQWVL